MTRLVTPMGIPIGMPQLAGLGVPPPNLSQIMMVPKSAPPPLDKSVPPPNTLVPPPFGIQTAANTTTSGDGDQRDNEMEDEQHKEATPIMNAGFFAHPPPGMAMGGLIMHNVPPPALPISGDSSKNAGNNNDTNDYKRSSNRSQSRESIHLKPIRKECAIVFQKPLKFKS